MIKIIKRKKNRSSFELPKKNRIFSSRGLFRLTMLIFLGTVVFVLFFSDFLVVRRIEISGLDKLEEALIRDVIDEKIEGEYFNLVRRNNLILFPKNSLEEELAEKFKRIDFVSIKKIFPDKIDLVVKERQFTMLLCSSGSCYLLNEKGMAYPAENFTQEELARENLITLHDSSGAKIGTEVAPLEDEFQKFAVELYQRVLAETAIELKKNYETPSRMSGDLRTETTDGWKIYFSANIGMERELLMLRTVLGRSIEKERQKDLEYIDLRIANKVFYKFKEGLEQVAEAESVPAPPMEVKKEKKKK